MGAVVASLIPPVAAALFSLFGGSSGSRVGANPVIEELNSRAQAAEQARGRAVADAARIANQAGVQARQAGQERSDRAVASAQAEARAQAAEQARAQAVAEATRTANQAAEQAKQAKAEQEQSARAARQAEEQARAARAEREEWERTATQAAEQARAARAEQEEARKAAGRAEEEAKKAQIAQAEAERQLRDGVRPVVWPSLEEIEMAKRRYQYTEGKFHFAVAGIAGSGKSSLINAFRGLRNRDRGAAAAGIVETTRVVARYPDIAYPFVWYDIPGAGTPTVPDWQYFNMQGLFVFDCIIVLFDNRFTETDVTILKNCQRFNIPSYIVRSKSDQHIRNIMIDMGYCSDDEDRSHDEELYKTSVKKYSSETRQSVQDNLREAGLPPQRVYIVSNVTLLGIVKSRSPRNKLDEVELLRDVLSEAHKRRSVPISTDA